jgi:hypothetical protein
MIEESQSNRDLGVCVTKEPVWSKHTIHYRCTWGNKITKMLARHLLYLTMPAVRSILGYATQVWFATVSQADQIGTCPTSRNNVTVMKLVPSCATFPIKTG